MNNNCFKKLTSHLRKAYGGFAYKYNKLADHMLTNVKIDDTMSEDYRENLMSQLREAYGRLTYTYTTHNKMANRMITNTKRITFTKISLSALSTSGLLGTLLVDKYWLKIVTALISAALLGINLYFKESKTSEQILDHQKAANSLWLLREKYLSLMTDFDQMSAEEICTHRDKLTKDTSQIYGNTPQTDSKSYAAAQTALKEEEEQFFTDDEIDKMLPKHLRKSNLRS